ncbi:DUF1549 and DUF1553 domain-containing protein [bacterium]|nr:DUF1549 and DUF1553 domain-containing protein [bacterium]MDG1890498.1 DUF1553 domain-containing protein [Verrucomicrobiota bacterium]
MTQSRTKPVHALLLMIAALFAWSDGTAHAQESLQILPREIALRGANASQRLMVVQMQDTIARGEVLVQEWISEDSEVARIDEHGILHGRADGKAVIRALTSKGEVSILATVSGHERSQPWSFEQHVLPVFSKAGCNQGACHGALAGKGGFRLSLRGYDPDQDHQSITREALGRRIESVAPERSLLVTKPTMALRHKGGKRLNPGSRDYRILVDWIAKGAPASPPDEPTLSDLEVMPSHSILTQGDQQRLLVRATYSDGRVEDVTQWARFSSVDETIARVNDRTGLMEVHGPGEGAVSVWFSSQVVIAHVTVPYPQHISAPELARQPVRNFIDQINLEQLRKLHLLPSPRSSDSEFIRRVYLDTIGRLPEPHETLDFLASTAPNKRDQLIDRLLATEAFVDYWAYRWSDVFLVNSRLLRPKAIKAYYSWIRENVRHNTPWDDWVRQVLTVQGDSLEQGASNFYALHQAPETMAENVSQAFLGLSINCAKCHNHPLEKWTNNQYYSFANLFARVRAKGWGGDARSGDGRRTLYAAKSGELIQPRSGKPQAPAPLDADPLRMDDPSDRRTHLADWITSPDNPYFTRSVVNRIWAALLGTGLIEPVDDLRVSNPASSEALLSALSDYLIQKEHDLKSLMQVILQSETYQRSSRILPQNKTESRYYTRYYPRRLMAEVLQDAIASVTDVADDYEQTSLTDGSLEKTDFYPKGTRAIELFDSAVASYFLKTFGRNERAITCACERSNQPSMVQVLHLSNGGAINDKLHQSQSRVQKLLRHAASDEDFITQAYLWCLSRQPSHHEIKAHSTLLKATAPEEKHLAAADLFWALMTSREFLFQH